MQRVKKMNASLDDRQIPPKYYAVSQLRKEGGHCTTIVDCRQAVRWGVDLECGKDSGVILNNIHMYNFELEDSVCLPMRRELSHSRMPSCSSSYDNNESSYSAGFLLQPGAGQGATTPALSCANTKPGSFSNCLVSVPTAPSRPTFGLRRSSTKGGNQKP